MLDSWVSPFRTLFVGAQGSADGFRQRWSWQPEEAPGRDTGARAAGGGGALMNGPTVGGTPPAGAARSTSLSHHDRLWA